MQPNAYKVFSERARESALRVRRHQSALGASATPGGMTPAIAARVKEILAGKKKGGKAKGKAAKKKDSRTPQEKKNQNITQVAKQTGMGDLEGPLVRVADGMAKGGDDLEKEAHDKLVEKGLATRHADGSLSLSPAGKKWKAAADKGDADGATAALTEAGAARADTAAKEKVKDEKQVARETAKAERVAKHMAKQAETAKKKEAAVAKVKQAKKPAASKPKPDAKPATPATAKPAPAAALPRSQAPTISGGGGAAPKAPKADPTVARAKNVTAVADATGLGDHLANLDKFKAGGELNEKDATELEKRGLVERGADGTVRMSSAGTALIAAAARGDTRAAQDAVSRAKDKKVTKALDDNELDAPFPFAIKQTDQERAMFAAMGESGSLRPQNSKGNRPKPRKGGGGGAGGGGGGSGSSSSGGAGASSAGSSSSSSSSPSSSSSGGGPGGRATLRAPVSGDMEAHARFVETKQKLAALRKEQRVLKTKLKHIDAKQSNHDRMAKLQDKKNRIDALGAEIRAGGLTLARTREIGQALRKIRAEKALLEDFIMDDNELAIKAGARHSAGDATHLNEAAKHLHAAGATCPDCPVDEGADVDEAATVAIKGIMDDPGYYAQHECQDILQACSALQTIAMLIQSELGEDDEDPADVSELCNAADILIEFIQGELDEVRGAAKEDAKTIGHEPMKAVEAEDIEVKAIAARPDVNPKEGAAEYGDVTFADAKNKKYPVDTEAHVRSAWNFISQADNAAKYDPDEVDQIKARIVAAWKKLIDKAGPPSAQSKAVDDIPSLDQLADMPLDEHLDGGAIKAVGDEISGYAVLFGDATNHDIERDYYTKATNFWLDDFGFPRPITYHHGLDAATRDNPVIGHWTKATVDDTGVWLSGQLDRAHAYYKAIKELAARGYLKLSSDSAPQWVQREKQPSGANFVKRWPLVTASTTVSPMEPRMFPVEVKAYLAELGYEAIEEPEVKADDSRARALLLELELLELEVA